MDARKIVCKLDHYSDFYDSVVLCGMGGSATCCDILNDLMQTFSTKPSTIRRGQKIPYWVGKRSLVILKNVGLTLAQIGQSLMEESTYPATSLIKTIMSSINVLDYSTIYLPCPDQSPKPAIDILKRISLYITMLSVV